MKTVSVDMDYLVFAYQDDRQDNAYYLDTEFGDVRMVNRNLHDLKDLTDEIELEHERFLYVPKTDKDQTIEDLKAFRETISNDQLKELLQLSFDTRSQSATFKSIISKDSQELERLNQFLNQQARERVTSWLAANGIEPEQTEPI
jgi:hypothetical protein